MSRSISIDEYVDQNPHLFRRLHRHDGIWWDQLRSGFSRPAFKFQPVVPGEGRPSRSAAWLGYSHCVPEAKMGNQVHPYMVLEGEDLHEFSLERLGTLKRNRVRKGLKCCRVEEVPDLEGCLEEAREVCASHAERGAPSQEAFHASSAFFIEQAEVWRAQMRRDFPCEGRAWFGAWYEQRLIGYVVTLHVEDILMIEKVKLHTDYLRYCPSDALYFHVLSQAAGTPDCRRVFNSAPQRPGLDRFKELFLFKPTAIPFYLSNPAVYQAAMRVMTVKNRLLAGFRAHKARRDGNGAMTSPAEGAGSPGSGEAS